MKYLKILLMLLAINAVVILFSSCSESLVVDSKLQETTTELRSEDEFNTPTVERDRYKFRDFDHLTSYYQTLDALYEEEGEIFDLTVSENNLINSVYTKLANDEFTNPEDRYQPFMADPIMMSIVNEYFEFQVGNMLITYMNNEEFLMCDPEDVATQSRIRSMSKGNKLNINTIPPKAWWGQTDDKVTQREWCGCDIKIEKISCNEVRVFGTCKNFVFGEGEGTVEIFTTNSPAFPINGPFGPPTPIQTHRVNGNFEFIILITSPNTPVHIHASANPDCFVGNLARTSFEFTPEAACDPNERDTGFLWAQDNGVQGYSHRTSYYKNFWSAYEEAKMWSKWWDGTKWKPNKADLEVTIDAIRKNDTCLQIEQEQETRTGHRKDIRARVNTGVFGAGRFVHHCDGDVTGTYKKTLNWNGSTWSIDAIGEVDFECCE